MNERFAIRDLFGFEKIIAPTILKVIYWIGLVVITFSALAALFGGGMMAGHMATYGGGFLIGRVLGSIVAWIMLVLVWRVLFEVYYVFFGIYTRLGEIRDRLAAGE
ncbi:MAG: DUF4282 domain-containing protein [Alphaproteobacteria bacterium]|nr:MAG: DUF4282 domain-containing protein [Alphaproteobacteria bacterium]